MGGAYVENLVPESAVGGAGGYGDTGLKERKNNAYVETASFVQSQWAQAALDKRVRAGDMSAWGEIFPTVANRKEVLSVNKVKRACETICGYQRKNRKKLMVSASEAGDQATADQLSKCLFWAWNNASGDEVLSDAFDGCITTGMNLIHVWMDYREDPVNGDIRFENIDNVAFIIDPFFKKQDLSDCNYIWTRRFVSRQTAKMLLPGNEERIDSIKDGGNVDGRFEYMAQTYNVQSTKLMVYDEFWYREFRKGTFLLDRETGESIEWKHEKEDANPFLRQYPQLILTERQVPTSKVGITLQDRVMYDGKSPFEIDAMPFVVVEAYRNPDLPVWSDRIQGLVRNMRSMAYVYNRRLSISLDMLESQPNTGYIAKEDALVNPKDIFMTGQGRAIFLKKEAQMTDIQKIQPGDISPGMQNISETLDRELKEVSLVSEELYGVPDTNDTSGIQTMLRQSAGLTVLQKPLDKLDFSQKRLGELGVELIVANWSPGKIQRIIREEPTPFFFKKSFGKYDCSVEEAIYTSTRKQVVLNQLIRLKELGINIPEETLFEYIVMQDKEKVLRSMQQQQQQQQQMRQMEMQLKMREADARIREMDARSMANRGLGMERSSRVQENRALAVERLAESEKDRQNSDLMYVKMLREIEQLDIDNLRRLIEVAEVIKQNDAQEDLKEEEQVVLPNVEEVAVMKNKEGAENAQI